MTAPHDGAGTVAVLGAAGGIGSAICRRLSALGWQVVAADVDETALRRLSQTIDTLRVVVGDVSSSEVVREVGDVAESSGALRSWVNSVGTLSQKPLDQLDDAEIASQLATNLLTTVYGCREAVRRFVGAGVMGSIVNLGSIHSAQPFRGLPLYAASKGAIEALTRQLCVEYGGAGIRINTVAPGAVDTVMARGTDMGRAEERLAAAADLSPMNRVSAPDEIAGVVAMLISAGAVGINGAVLRVDNGMAAIGRNR